MALTGACAAVAAPMASAEEAAAPSRTVYANVNGYGAKDRIDVRVFDAEHHEMTVTFNSDNVQTYLFAADSDEVRLPRVTDINRDGRDEVVVGESTGANTEWFRMITYVSGKGLSTVTKTDGKRFPLKEGGGATARSGYACEVTTKPVLTNMVAEVNDDGETFQGHKSYYTLDESTLTRRGVVEFADLPQDHDTLNPKPSTCRP